MSNPAGTALDKNAYIAATMILGRKKEPFLAACLESVCDAVDILVLNDNSGDSSSPNLETVKCSRIYREGRVIVIPSKFNGFGYCRNICLDYLASIDKPEIWVLYLDADEVHSSGFKAVTRKILPNLPAEIGIVDGYFFQFFQSPRYYLAIDRRHNLLFRYNPEIRWEGSVHEKPVNSKGKRIAIPYRYFHYGYLIKPQEILKRWKMYESLGDQISGSNKFDEESLFKGEAQRVFLYHGVHPAAARQTLNDISLENENFIRRFEQFAKNHKSALKIFSKINFDLRFIYRFPEVFLRFWRNRDITQGIIEMIKTST